MSIEVQRRSVRVYNIEVNGEHVYEVGDFGVLVHNACATVLGDAITSLRDIARTKFREAHHIIGRNLKGELWDKLRAQMVKQLGKEGLDHALNGVWLYKSAMRGVAKYLKHHGNGYHSNAMAQLLTERLAGLKGDAYKVALEAIYQDIISGRIAALLKQAVK